VATIGMSDSPPNRSLQCLSWSRAAVLRALRRIVASVVLGVALSLGGTAAVAARALPSDATFAAEAEFRYPYVMVNKQVLRLAVGARIYNERNLIVMPATMPEKANVLFKTDINGDISRVWILTDDEAQTYENNK